MRSRDWLCGLTVHREGGHCETLSEIKASRFFGGAAATGITLRADAGSAKGSAWQIAASPRK